MARCPLCSERVAKRYCPAKARKICSVCCGTKREIEIDCPSSCVYLRAGRSFQASRQAPPLQSSAAAQFNQQLLHRNTLAINAVAQTILGERRRDTQMVDRDVEKALEALRATMKTLSSGIYYETLPDGGSVAITLYRQIKTVLEELIQPQGRVGAALRVSDIPEMLDFILSTVESRTSGRPRSRQYLEWLASVAPEPRPEQEKRLILP